MSEIPASNPTVPFLRPTEEQASKVRRQLEQIYGELDLVQDLLQVCGEASNAEVSSSRKIDHVLRRCGSHRLSLAQKTLRSLIERFGGTTEMSELGQEGHP
jgi:hypothetical protein